MFFTDFKGNYSAINSFKTFLKDNGIVLLIGDHASGKTSFYTMLKNEKKYDILYVTDSNFNEQTIHNFIECKTITSFFSSLEKLVFIDDIDVISNFNKNMVSNFTKFKTLCKIVLTVKLKEEKKIVTTWKKLIDQKIYLNKLNYKDCYQVMLKKTENDDDIDPSKLIELIKSQNCHIPKIEMLLDSIRENNEDLDVLHDESDLFHNNIYTIVSDIYNENLSNEYIHSLSSKDNSIITSVIHENIVNHKCNIKNYIDIYDILCNCDVIDKHIYVNCLWGLNWDSLNIYRYKKLNNIFLEKKNEAFKICFTQQFTKLSSQMNIKKKLQTITYPTYIFDILFHLYYKSSTIEDKTLKDLVTKFKKDFNL